MGRFAEAANRLFKNKFICKKCKSSVRATNLKVIAGKVACRSCKCKSLRVVRKK